MKNYISFQLKVLSILGFVILAVPLTIYILWLNAFSLGNNQEVRVDIFNSYFPEILNGRWTTTIISIIFCLGAMFLSSVGIRNSKKFWKFLNILNLVISSFLFMLNIFSML